MAAPRQISSQERRLRAVLAKNVRVSREHQGMTLEHAAERADIHWTSWQRIEAGTVGTSLEMIGNLAAALDIDPLDLFIA